MINTNKIMKLNLALLAFAILFVGCAHVPSGSPGASFYREGISLYNSGKLDESASMFRKAYGADPQYAPAYMMLGKYYFAKGDSYRAEMFFRKALALDDELTQIYGFIGDIYWEDGDTTQAMDYYERCPKEDFHYAVLHYKIGMREYQGGNSSKAKTEFRKAIDTHDYWGGHYGLGLLAFGNKNYEKALDEFNLIENSAEVDDAIYWLGRTYYQLGWEPEAYLYLKRYTHCEEAKSNLASEANEIACRLKDRIANPDSCEVDSTCIIPFKLDENSDLTVGVYNLEGQLVKTIFQGCITHGDYTLTWKGIDEEGNEVPEGMYLGFIKTDERLKLHPMLWQN